jgi:signal transduction histidine kinase
MFGSGILPDRHTLTLGLILLAGLLGIALKDHHIFQTIIGILTVVGLWGIYVTAWNSRYVLRNAYLSFIGIAYLFVGLISLLHILSNKGMGFTSDANLPAQLWIIASCLQSASLVIAPFLLDREIKTGLVFASFSVVSAGLLASVLYWHNFPAFFMAGIGPTDFAETSEYVTILFFFASIVTLSLKRPAFEFGAFWTLVASLTLSGLSELALAFHTKFFWATSETGLFLRLIAVYLMYRVFLKAGIFAPFNLIFRNLALSEKNLFSLIEGLPAFVFVQMPDYTIRYANRVFRDLFGNPEGLTCYEILKGDKKPCERCPTREIFRTGVPQRRDWGLIKDKTYAIYEYPYLDLDDSTAVLKLGIDITDRKKMETELIAARNELENRVRERTAELTRTNEILQFEFAERERVQKNLEQSEEELRLLSLRLLHAQEMERKHIALELHDSLGGSLSAIKFRTEHAICQMGLSSDANPKQLFGDIILMLQNLLEEVRRIHTHIWPSILSDFGLIAAINWHCRKFVESYPHIKIEKSILIEETGTPDILKIVVFRIIQEALNNIAKHSGADLATIRLRGENCSLDLSILDNGKGFDVTEARESALTNACVGITGMRERTRLSGGSLEIRSGETGTEISASWPLGMISEQVGTAT